MQWVDTSNQQPVMFADDIVGGESGPGAREMKREWVVDVRRQCRVARVAFFFKQWGGVNKKRAGRIFLDGRTYDEFPAAKAERSHRPLVVLA